MDYRACEHSMWSEPTRVQRFENADDGTETIVDATANVGRPYRVLFRDTDADRTIAVEFYADKDRAITRALNLCAGVK